MDGSSIAGLISSLSALKDIAQAMIGLRDSQALQAQLLEFQSGLIAANGSALAAQQEHFSLLATVRRLEEEVAALKAWEAEKQRYELADVGRGVMARRLKPSMTNGEPSHCICANCYENGQKSHLQPETRYPGGSEHLVCHHCPADLVVNGPRRDGPLPKVITKNSPEPLLGEFRGFPFFMSL